MPLRNSKVVKCGQRKKGQQAERKLLSRRTYENSPTFQRWVRVAQTIRPGGTVEHCVISRPCGTWRFCLVKPNAQALGYCRMSLRDENFTVSAIFLQDDDSLAFTWFHNSLTALWLGAWAPGVASAWLSRGFDIFFDRFAKLAFRIE